MNRYALIQDGIVTNVILWDGKSQWLKSSDLLILLSMDSPVCPSYTYDGAFFTAPSPQPPPFAT